MLVGKIATVGAEAAQDEPRSRRGPWPWSRPAAAAQQIEFLCRPEDHGGIAEPYPARENVPAWFRKLPPVDQSVVTPTNNGLTIKRCMPFFDALITGWILPVAATFRLEVRDNGRTVDAGWEFDRTMVSNHSPYQVAGNPREPRPPCKVHNYWTIRTPPGWSCLFVAPLNRPGSPIEPLAGVVDTDTYTSEIHFPFFATAGDGLYTLERGTPLVQVIPFLRSATQLPGAVRAEAPPEAVERKRIFRSTIAAHGWYRLNARARR